MKKFFSLFPTGTIEQVVLDRYRELETNHTALKTQIDMFRGTLGQKTLGAAVSAYRGMSADVRALFPSVKILLKLMLVCPATSCTCERSFSALRRLKTWLRNTMTQLRLNSCAVCSVHRSYVDDVDITHLAREFASRSETRKHMFGKFP